MATKSPVANCPGLVRQLSDTPLCSLIFFLCLAVGPLCVSSAFGSPKEKEIEAVEIETTFSAQDTIIFAMSGLFLIALRLWSFDTRIFRTRHQLGAGSRHDRRRGPPWTVWQRVFCLVVVIVTHAVAILGTVFLDDPWGSKSWSWAQCVQPMVSLSLVWALFGDLKPTELQGPRIHDSALRLMMMLRQFRYHFALATLVLILETGLLVWMQGYDVIVLMLVAIASIFLEIEPGRRLTTPFLRRSRESALGAGFLFARPQSMGSASVLASLDDGGRIAFEDSIYTNPVSSTGNEGASEEQQGLETSGRDLTSALQHRSEGSVRSMQPLGTQADQDVVYVPVNLELWSVYGPDRFSRDLIRCYIPNGLGEWLAELACLTESSAFNGSCSLSSFHFMSLYAMVTSEYLASLLRTGDSENDDLVITITHDEMSWPKVVVKDEEFADMAERDDEYGEWMESDRKDAGILPWPNHRSPMLLYADKGLRSPAFHARSALTYLQVSAILEVQEDISGWWSDGETEPGRVEVASLLERFPVLKTTMVNEMSIPMHPEYLYLPTPLFLLTGLIIPANQSQSEDCTSEKAGDDFTRLVDEVVPEGDAQANCDRRVLMKAWKRAVVDGPFRIRWETIQPDFEESESQDWLEGWLMFKVLSGGDGEANWVQEYANAYAEALAPSAEHRGGVTVRTILSDLNRKEAKGNRRLYEVRLAIIERLLLLQGASSALIGAKAILSAL